MGWLVGVWERSHLPEGRQAFEYWEMNEAGNLEGTGISVRDGDTTVFEKLSVIEKGGTYYYVADVPENPAPVEYAIGYNSHGMFRASNPHHDFPTAISYQLDGEKLHVEISGDEKTIPFDFIKQE